MTADEQNQIVIGRISGLYGVKGWVRLFSYTDPKENIVKYGVWHVRQQGASRQMVVAEGRLHGKGVIARLEGVEDRDQAAAFVGAEISVDRSALAPCEAGEYYWADLIGLRVVTVAGQELGRVVRLMETGANDVLVIGGAKEHLVPFALDRVVKKVDLANGTIEVDWDPDY